VDRQKTLLNGPVCVFTGPLCAPVVRDALRVHGLTGPTQPSYLMRVNVLELYRNSAQLSDGQRKPQTRKVSKSVKKGPKNFEKKGSRH